MFHGFNGEFRRKPEVSIRGASKKETKEELLRRAQLERSKREVT
jgi:ubiquitin-protein ligase E3 C